MIEIAAEQQKKLDRAMLVAVRMPEDDPAVIAEHLDELAELVEGCDFEVADKVTVPVKMPHVNLYMGSGKAEEIAQLAAENNIDCLVFDTPLSPSQQRNWEKLTRKCVVDREEIILDIFAARASTREAVLQIELARMKYMLPRLTRAWTHLSRQKGGVAGTRGEGETQIETDRRLLRKRIMMLEKDLAAVRKQRSTARKKRERGSLPTAALVGYTNVGKSSLLKSLTGAEILVEDKLFATLDPTTRKVKLADNSRLLVTDTVGFVRKLPHTLVEAFKSTLEEAVFADFLILVLDISSPQLDAHRETTMEVLHELGADKKDIQIVFNKIDKLDPVSGSLTLARCRALFPQAVFCSTLTGEGMDDFKAMLQQKASGSTRAMQLLLPPDRFDLRSFAAARGTIMFEEYDDFGNLRLDILINEQFKHKFENFVL